VHSRFEDLKNMWYVTSYHTPDKKAGQICPHQKIFRIIHLIKKQDIYAQAIGYNNVTAYAPFVLN